MMLNMVVTRICTIECLQRWQFISILENINVRDIWGWYEFSQTGTCHHYRPLETKCVVLCLSWPAWFQIATQCNSSVIAKGEPSPSL